MSSTERSFYGDLEEGIEGEVNVSRLIIPFSSLFKPYKPKDVYSGNENIPFKKRETEFKMIFRQEFMQ